MSRPDLLPRAVETVVSAFLHRVDAERSVSLHGLYLVGSVAPADFRPAASAIDFVAVVEAVPTQETCASLARIHTALTKAGGPSFDGVYLTAAALRRVPRDYAAAPFSLDGRLRTGVVCREINPVDWRCLARHGKALLGPSPSELGIADDGGVLCAYQIDNLRTYWSSWIEQAEGALAARAPGEGASATALAWGVLGVARIACALETDRVVSKFGGRRHALAGHLDRWHPVIRKALAAHRGTTERVPVETVRDGSAYMRWAMAGATRQTIGGNGGI